MKMWPARDFLKKISPRYGAGHFDLRIFLFHVIAWSQRKKNVIIRKHSSAIPAILTASEKKGSFIERLFAQPAWWPALSIESMDGETWKTLSVEFKKILLDSSQPDRLKYLVEKHFVILQKRFEIGPHFPVDSEFISKWTAHVFFEYLFQKAMSDDDENLFYMASLEWRKEIALKGKGNFKVKEDFLLRLRQIIEKSRFAGGFEKFHERPEIWTSIFAQPFLISPMINFSDVFASTFDFLKVEEKCLKKAQASAQDLKNKYLEGILLESIRLRHPFPILERELTADLTFDGKVFAKGTHFLILLDQLDQDTEFNPERWLLPPHQNLYWALPFAAGARGCPGKQLALESMSEMLRHLLVLPLDQVSPILNHKFSGRDNDQLKSFKELTYQFKMLLKAVIVSFRIRFGLNS